MTDTPFDRPARTSAGDDEPKGQEGAVGTPQPYPFPVTRLRHFGWLTDEELLTRLVRDAEEGGRAVAQESTAMTDTPPLSSPGTSALAPGTEGTGEAVGAAGGDHRAEARQLAAAIFDWDGVPLLDVDARAVRLLAAALSAAESRSRAAGIEAERERIRALLAAGIEWEEED